jgi:hypothetical protein
LGNWRTVNMTGTMTEADAAALREYLGYPGWRHDRGDDPAYQRFGPLSFCRDQPSLCGINDWPAPVVNRNGNLAERGYDVDDVAETLRELVAVAGSMMLVVHCGGDYESLDCVATIRVGEGVVTVGKPEVERVAEIDGDQQMGNLFRALTGGYQ